MRRSWIRGGTINELIYVTYAEQNAHKHDDVAGPGHGFIDIFTTDGLLVKRMASGGTLNSPWGLARAPAGFGRFSGRLLAGNFGDGADQRARPVLRRLRWPAQ